MVQHQWEGAVRKARLDAAAALLLAMAQPLVSTTAGAAQPTYLDDRSSAARVIQSYYNAINRHEYARAYSYFGPDSAPSDYARFKAGFSDTAQDRVGIGRVSSDGTAGSVYYSVPVVLDATSTSGRQKRFRGCYTLRLIDPAIQEPPFRAMFIVKGELQPVPDGTTAAMPDCSP
jgi:hypothetical protein